MDATTAFNAISKLVEQYPDVSTAIVQDVLHACNQDPVRAYDKLSDMLAPHLALSETAPSSSVIPPTDITNTSSAPASYARPLQGAWAQGNMGRKYRVEQMCERYDWLDRRAAHSLFEKHQDVTDLVEADILQMFPIDEPSSYATPNTPQQQQQQQQPTLESEATPTCNNNNTGASQLSKQLREKAEAEMRKVANPSPIVTISSPSIKNLRQQVWEKRHIAFNANRVASQTRKPELIADARQKNDELSKLSAYLLERIRQTVDYKYGYVDLHGLTREEAIQLVEHRISDSISCSSSSPSSSSISKEPIKLTKRFHIITGRGNNSINGQAILGPALERHLSKRGISFSSRRDGIISVTPIT